MTDSVTPAIALHAYFGYRDAPAAIDWLGRAFGFTASMSFPDDAGGVMHSELRLGDAVIVVFSDREGYERAPRKGDTSGSGIYFCVPDRATVDAVHSRALAEGATVVWEPADTQWGNYRCRVVDPEGYEWTFGTHRPGEPRGDRS